MTSRPPYSRLIQHLGRRTSSGDFLPVIDGLRFVALWPVVLYHVITHLEGADPTAFGASGFSADMARHGEYGLHMFFIMSGFILGVPFARAYFQGGRIPLRKYFLRRLTRVEPPYVLIMIGLWLMYPLAGMASTQELAPHLGAGLLYAHGMVYADLNPVNQVAWSLEVEVQFYLLMPLLASVFRIRDVRLRRQLLVAGIVASTGVAHLVVGGSSWMPLSLIDYLNLFLVGLLLADLFVVGGGRTGTSLVGDAAFVSGLVALVLVPVGTPAATLVSPLGSAAMIGGAMHGRSIRRVLESPPIFVVGGMCYSVYLCHLAVILLLSPYVVSAIDLSSPTLEVLARAAVFLAAILAVSVAFFVLVERPCMRPDWPQRVGLAFRTARGRLRTRGRELVPEAAPAFARSGEVAVAVESVSFQGTPPIYRSMQGERASHSSAAPLPRS
jgi:peptidoglycan/LPS O-acetylase OafA/YrhL